MVDLAEWALKEAVWAGEPWAIMFVLRTMGRSRGWGRDAGPAVPADAAPSPVRVVDPATLAAGLDADPLS
jgi:hypothetical protein